MRLLGQFRTAIKLGSAAAREAPRLMRGLAFPHSGERLWAAMRQAHPTNAAYDDLVRYMALSWLTYRNEAGSAAELPGHRSWSGADCDALEGYSRMMPLFAAWCASGRPEKIEVAGRTLSLVDEFRRGLLSGTDPGSRFYWGEMPGRSNQRIVEAADIALALWLLRRPVWEELEPAQKRQVAAWLAQARGKPGLDNNWQLFFVLIDRVLESLGCSERIDAVRARYERVKSFHVGSGWFADGPGGRVDYYNAWGFHYALAWIDRIDPEWDPVYLSQLRRAFLRDFRFFVGPSGFPAFGRSLSYRLAVPAPLVAASMTDPDIVSPGEARGALDAIWSHFVSRGALRRGTITQGFHDADLRLLEPYSGPASSLWSLRSLVMAYAEPPGSPFWEDPPEPVPVERGDFTRALPITGWRLHGCQAMGLIALEIEANGGRDAPRLPRLGVTDRLRCTLGLMQRPTNYGAKYEAPVYRSDRVLWLD